MCFAQGTQLVALAKTKTGWGYIDTTGAFLIDPKFTRAFGMGDDGTGMVVSWRQKLDLSGEELAIVSLTNPDFPIYLGSDFNTENSTYARFQSGYFVAEEAGGYSYINPKGEPLFDYVYDRATPFENGYSAANSDGICYIVRPNGTDRAVLKDICKETGAFINGIARFEATNKRFGAFDTTGQMVIPPTFDKIGHFYGGIAWAREVKGDVGFIDTKGNWVVKPTYKVCEDFDPNSGIALVKDKSTGWHYIDMNENELLIAGLSSYSDFSEGLCHGRTESTNLYGFLNNKGEWAIPMQFEAVRKFKNGYAAAKKNGKWGFIDKTGYWIVGPQFVHVKDFERVNR